MGEDQEKSSRAAPLEISRLVEPLAALQRLLEHINQPGVIIGGIAASLIGKPRVTADLDAVIMMSADDLPELIDAARQQGLIPRIANEIEFARKNRVLLLIHEDSGVGVDISLGMLPFESEMIDRSEIVRIGELAVRLPTPEDLIIMKAIAQRPKDLEDIRAISASHPDLDTCALFTVGHLVPLQRIRCLSGTTMDFETYRKNYYIDPQPEPRFNFGAGIRGAVLYYEDYPAAIDFYTHVFGPPNYVEGDSTHGWRLGESWLTLFPSKSGSPANLEVPFYLPTRIAVDTLFAALIEAGAQGEPPAETLMYRLVYMAIVTDPFGIVLDLVCEVG